jgi:hypothetical protein
MVNDRDTMIDDLIEWCEQDKLYFKCINKKSVHYKKEYKIIDVVDVYGNLQMVVDIEGNETGISFDSDDFELVVKSDTED